MKNILLTLLTLTTLHSSNFTSLYRVTFGEHIYLGEVSLSLTINTDKTYTATMVAQIKGKLAWLYAKKETQISTGVKKEFYIPQTFTKISETRNEKIVKKVIYSSKSPISHSQNYTKKDGIFSLEQETTTILPLKTRGLTLENDYLSLLFNLPKLLQNLENSQLFRASEVGKHDAIIEIMKPSNEKKQGILNNIGNEQRRNIQDIAILFIKGKMFNNKQDGEFIYLFDKRARLQQATLKDVLMLGDVQLERIAPEATSTLQD